MTFIVVIEPNDVRVEPSNGALEELQKIVGGFIEPVPTYLQDRGYMLFVNEEGLLRGLQHNPLASALAEQPLVGSAALVRYATGERIIDVEDDVASTLLRMKRAVFPNPGPDSGQEGDRS